MSGTFPTWKLVIFALLSVGDFSMTYFLLSNQESGVYESNPVAEQTLAGYGWVGLALFKSAIVMSVVGIAIYLHRRRPRIAHDLLAVGCGAVVVAILSGGSIAIAIAHEVKLAEEEQHQVEFGNYGTGNLPPMEDEYAFRLEELAHNLVHEQTTLEQATHDLQELRIAQNLDWYISLREVYPGLSNPACLSAELVQCTMESRIRSAGSRRLAARLEAEFQNLYGFVPQLPYHRLLPLAPKD